MPIFIMLFITITVTIFVGVFNIKTIRDKQIGIVERLGAYNRSLAPGTHFLIPFSERVIIVNQHDTYEWTQETISYNGKPVFKMDMIIDYTVSDAKFFMYTVKDIQKNLAFQLHKVVKGYYTEHGLIYAEDSQTDLSEYIKEALTEPLTAWGIQIEALKVTKTLRIKK